MTLHAKMVMHNLQHYPWNLNLIKNVENIVVFLTKKCLFLRISPLLLISKKCTSHLSQREPQMKISRLKKQKHWYLIGTWLDRAFKGTNVNRVLPLVHGDWRLEIGDWRLEIGQYFSARINPIKLKNIIKKERLNEV